MSSSSSAIKKLTPIGAWLGSSDRFEILGPLHIIEMDKEVNLVHGKHTRHNKY